MDTDARRVDQGSTPPPRPTPEIHAGAAIGREDRCLLVCMCVFIGFFASFLLWFIVEASRYKEPNYSVAIAAVSGLDPETDLGRRPVLAPEFHITVAVVRRSPLIFGCGQPDTTLQVSYHGFELASATVPQFCVTEHPLTVVARGIRVWLPGPAVDSLAADLRRAAGMFDVTITIPNKETRYGVVHGQVISCTGRRVGEDIGGAALCDVRETVKSKQ